MRKCAILLPLLLASCAALDTVVDVFDPLTGEKTGETTLGSIVADSGKAVGDAAGSVVGGLTGNPMLGIAAAAGLTGLFSAARRKKKQRTAPPESYV
jgi:hypothetical protein